MNNKKQVAQFAHYLRLVQLITSLTASEGLRWHDKAKKWDIEAIRLGLRLQRNYPEDRQNFDATVVAATAAGVKTHVVVSRVLPWLKPPSGYIARRQHSANAAHSGAATITVAVA